MRSNLTSFIQFLELTWKPLHFRETNFRRLQLLALLLSFLRLFISQIRCRHRFRFRHFGPLPSNAPSERLTNILQPHLKSQVGRHGF